MEDELPSPDLDPEELEKLEADGADSSDNELMEQI